VIELKSPIRIAFMLGLLLGSLSMGSTALALDPGPVHLCGAFVSYTPASATQSGTLVIGSTTFATSSGNPTPFRQVIAPGAVSGTQVCVDGTIATSQTTANLLTDFTVAPAPAASASPSATAATSLPSTATGTAPLAAIAALVLGGLALAALAMGLRRKRAVPRP
jgi:hypothetical protein